MQSVGSQIGTGIWVVLEEAPEGEHINMAWALWGCLAASPRPGTSTVSSVMP